MVVAHITRPRYRKQGHEIVSKTGSDAVYELSRSYTCLVHGERAGVGRRLGLDRVPIDPRTPLVSLHFLPRLGGVLVVVRQLPPGQVVFRVVVQPAVLVSTVRDERVEHALYLARVCASPT